MARKKVKTEPNVLKSVSLRASIIEKIKSRAEKEDRTEHYLMVQALEKEFNK